MDDQPPVSEAESRVYTLAICDLGTSSANAAIGRDRTIDILEAKSRAVMQRLTFPKQKAADIPVVSVHISSPDIAIRGEATIEDLIDILEVKSRSLVPVIYALNKIDSIPIEELDLICRIPNACPKSSEHG